jgi:hypothetical protein
MPATRFKRAQNASTTARAEAHIAAWQARQAVRQPSDSSRHQYRKALLRLWRDWERVRTEQP